MGKERISAVDNVSFTIKRVSSAAYMVCLVRENPPY